MMAAMAKGSRTEERILTSQPSAQTSRPKTANETPTAKVVTENQRMRAWVFVGAGKLMPVRLLLADGVMGSPVHFSVHRVRVAGEEVIGDYKDG